MVGLRCARCNDVIGVYERMVLILADGSLREGSPLTLDAEFGDPRTITIHEQCRGAQEDS